MAESLPVVTVPRDDGALGSGDISPEDIVVLHEVVVEELPVVEGFEGIDTTPFAVVTEPSEPSEPSAEDVIVIGSSSSSEEEEQQEEVVEFVERVAGGPPRGGMATDAGTHPVTVPSAMPIDDVPPDDTIPALPVQVETAPETASETDNPNLEKGEDADDEVRVLSETVVEEVVTTVVEVVEVATEEVPVNVDEVLLVNETVVEVMETEGEKGEKKRLHEEEEEDAVKKLKSEKEEEKSEKEEEKSEKEEEKSEKEEEKSEKEEEKIVEPKQLGPMLFSTSVELFSYFYNLLHEWSLNQDFNKYEFMVLSELVSQANPPKVGDGIASFQVRMHPEWQSRCFYLIRKDGSEDDFSYRKCCDALMPLPASLYRKTGELDLEKLFPGQKGRNHREQQQQNGGGRGGGRGDHRGGRGGGGGRFGGRGGGFGFGGGFGGRGRGGRGGGGGGRRGGRGRW